MWEYCKRHSAQPSGTFSPSPHKQLGWKLWGPLPWATSSDQILQRDLACHQRINGNWSGWWKKPIFTIINSFVSWFSLKASEALARQERLRKLLYVSCMKILESSKEYLQTLETSLSSAEAIFSLLFPAVTLKRSYSDMMADCIPCSSGAGASDGAGYLTSDSIEWEDGDIEVCIIRVALIAWCHTIL